MKKYFLIIFLFILCIRAESTSLLSSPLPQTSQPATAGPIQYFASLSMKEVQKLAGRKLKLKEKIALKIAQRKLKSVLKAGKQQDYKDKGKTAKLFGFISLASILLIPIAFFGILPCLAFGVAAIAVGKKAKKENPNDKNAKLGIVLGWIGVGIISAATIFVIAFLISYSGGLG